MDSSIFKDWLFRYNVVFKKRYTDPQKTRFIKSILSDIGQFRKDISVTEINKNEITKVRNIYVGNVKKADIIISTYYDTPSLYFGSYTFFDLEKKKNQSLWFNIIASTLTLIIGVLYTLYIAIPIFNSTNMLLLTFVILGYILLLLLTSKMSRGLPMRKTSTRNTSSVVYLMSLISRIKSKKIAFAFVDNGCKNGLGLEALLDASNNKSKVYHLDSIASKQNLFNLPDTEIINNNLNRNNLFHIISAKKKDDQYFLDKSDLKDVDESKFDQVDKYLNL